MKTAIKKTDLYSQTAIPFDYIRNYTYCIEVKHKTRLFVGIINACMNIVLKYFILSSLLFSKVFTE